MVFFAIIFPALNKSSSLSLLVVLLSSSLSGSLIFRINDDFIWVFDSKYFHSKFRFDNRNILINRGCEFSGQDFQNSNMAHVILIICQWVLRLNEEN